MVMTVWISNQMVELQTQLARDVNLLPSGGQVSSLDQSGSPITHLLAKGLSGDIAVGWFVILALYGACFVYTFVKYRRRTLYVESPDLVQSDAG